MPNDKDFIKDRLISEPSAPLDKARDARELNTAEYWHELVRQEMMQLVPQLTPDSDLGKMAMSQLRLAEKMLVLYATTKPVEPEAARRLRFAKEVLR